MELIDLLQQQLLQDDLSEAITTAASMHPADVAEALQEVAIQKQAVFLAALPHRQAAEILQKLELEEEVLILNQIGPTLATEILREMSTDDATDLLAKLPKESSDKLILLLQEEGQGLRELLEYEEDTSGGLMATEFVAVREDQTVVEVLSLLRKQAPAADIAYYIYVVDHTNKLTGVLSLRELVVSPLTAEIGSIMMRDVVSVPEDMDQEEVARLFDKYSFLVLPVVDEENRLIGIITVDDVLGVVEEEATEDIHKSASISPLETNYANAGVFTLFSKRVFWLLGLIIVNLISTGIMAAYEDVLASVITLTFFIPLLIDTGGNTGSQSATLIIRALVTKDVELSDWRDVFLKELAVGVSLGLVLGIAGSCLGLFRGDLRVAIVVGLTMSAIVIVANLIGMILPFILTHLRMDPAVISAPLITSIVDAVGLLIYFSIAAWVFQFSL